MEHPQPKRLCGLEEEELEPNTTVKMLNVIAQKYGRLPLQYERYSTFRAELGLGMENKYWKQVLKAVLDFYNL